MKVKSLSRVRLLATPWTVAHQAPPISGIFQVRVLEWGALPSLTINAGTLLFQILITVVFVGSGFGKTILYVCTYLLAFVRAHKLK